MKQTRLLIWIVIAIASNSFGAELRDVLAHPEKFENHRITVIGIARVPGYFWLCADKKTATDREPNPLTALLVRTTGKQPEYRELDRQWVEVTGIVSDKERDGYGGGPIVSGWRAGICLEHVRELHDRPPPRIKDSTVWGVFKNNTSLSLALDLVPRVRPGVESMFFLAPHETQAVEVDPGRADALKLEGPSNVRLDEQKQGKRVATGEITFHLLPRGWEYSRELSAERTLYFRVVGDRIEEVPASEGKRWKVR
jgi:hypothetical protein